jgi:glycosyltransferase involved in cell wall biosynthesis
MRIPYEGMAAARLTGAPIVVSVWGNDFTLYANRTPLMARATRTTMTHAAALHCDCQRDARLSRQWGFPTQRPVWILPGNGGVVESVFQPGPTTLPQKLGLSDETPIIVDPRGIREYVRTDVLFASLAHVLKRVPDVHVVCPGMAGSPIAESLVKENRLDHRVHLLPPVGRDEMGDIFRAARASVSLSTHDGTPNTLLEAMACGALPVVGDVESVREWVTHDHNGLVVRPDDQDGVAAALVRALTDDNLVDCARLVNAEIVHERASFSAGMQRAREYYQRLIEVADRAATPAD